MDDFDIQMAHLQKFGVIDKDQIAEQNHIPRKSKPKEIKKLYETPVDWEIDLHGLTIAEAEATILEIFEMARKARMNRIRIIHGGRLGHYGPVANHIQRMLKSQLRYFIQRFELDGLNDGALLIYLKQL